MVDKTLKLVGDFEQFSAKKYPKGPFSPIMSNFSRVGSVFPNI